MHVQSCDPAAPSEMKNDIKRTTKYQGSYIFLVLTVLYFTAVPAVAARDFAAAGVALIARIDQSTQIFLVRHHSRSWYEMPGGRRQTFEDATIDQGSRSETAYETAIRECYEESRGFLSPQFLRGIVDPSRMMHDGEFVFFVANTAWFSLTEISRAADSGDDNDHAFREIESYAWVPIDNVLASENDTVVDADGRSLKIRHQLKSRLARVRDAGWL